MPRLDAQTGLAVHGPAQPDHRDPATSGTRAPQTSSSRTTPKATSDEKAPRASSNTQDQKVTLDAQAAPTSSTDMIDRVVLLDDDGNPTGTADRIAVHTTQTPLHLAFSVHLVDPDGRTLVTRRALAKKTWPGVWTNSCCGHPRPNESMAGAAVRRVGEELGITLDPSALRLVLPTFRYRAVDAGGVVENEICPVHVARVGYVGPDPDPDEVAEHVWVPWADLHEAVRRTPFAFSPWLVLQAQQIGPVLPV